MFFGKLLKPEDNLESFVATLYGVNKSANCDESRYLKFCSKGKSPEPQKLPPTSDVLLCHCKRVSYVTAIIKKSLELCPEVPDLNGHGWNVDEDGHLEIQWMLRPIAPPEILQLISCNCKSRCATRNCVCHAHNVKCTDLCGCGSCDNLSRSSSSSSCSSSCPSDDDEN